MSPRQNRPRRKQSAQSRADADAESGRPANERREDWQGDDWLVRSVGGAAASKHYRCPGCDQEIPPGVPHLVAWPEHGGADSRRHWHSACWNARDRRRANLQRSRNAPRY